MNNLLGETKLACVGGSVSVFKLTPSSISDQERHGEVKGTKEKDVLEILPHL